VVCGGFAGAGRPEGVEFYRRCLSSLLPEARLLIETDAFISYMGAIGPRPGVLLIAGTGSIALAMDSSGKMIRAGGWGPAFSDEGGGFWIGQEAIRAALRAHDAGEASGFVSTIEDALGVKRITDVPAAWKDGAIHVRSVAALAPAVAGLYPADPAKRIMDEAATHLRNLCELARERANLPPSCVRAISGSIGALPQVQQSIGLQFSPPDNPPAKGAILWARDRLAAS
jgi:N-acetylglucosamine kinase-like BadF-type ATPase